MPLWRTSACQFLLMCGKKLAGSPPVLQSSLSSCLRSATAAATFRRTHANTHTHTHAKHTHTHIFTFRDLVVSRRCVREPGHWEKGPPQKWPRVGLHPIPSRLGEPSLGRWPDGADLKKSRKVSCRFTAAGAPTEGPGGSALPGAGAVSVLAGGRIEEGPRHRLAVRRKEGQ